MVMFYAPLPSNMGKHMYSGECAYNQIKPESLKHWVKIVAQYLGSRTGELLRQLGWGPEGLWCRLVTMLFYIVSMKEPGTSFFSLETTWMPCYKLFSFTWHYWTRSLYEA